MLSDTMKRVQEAEQQAADIINGAQDKAAQIVDDAKAEAKKRRIDAEGMAEAEAKAALADAERDGEAEREKYASRVNEQLATDQQAAYAKADEAVNAIIAGLV